jgi:tetratricopeptide (TPR) repeat protein
VKIDDTLAEAYASLAYIKRPYEWNWAGAEREFKRAIELNPNYATAHFWYGEHLTNLGRFDEGIAEIRRAEELDPRSPIISGSVGWALHIMKRSINSARLCNWTLSLPRPISILGWLTSANVIPTGRRGISKSA